MLYVRYRFPCLAGQRSDSKKQYSTYKDVCRKKELLLP